MSSNSPIPSPIPLILDLAWLAWKERHSRQHYPAAVSVGFGEDGTIWLRPNSLDSFALVLRAMPEEVRAEFSRLFWDQRNFGWGMSTIHEILLTDPLTLWPLLHRAAFGEGKPERYQ